MGVDKKVWLAAREEVEDRLLASPRADYTITGISGNELRTIDRDTASFNQLRDLVLTFIEDST